jgi:alginate O-acetyltransferase complex protein AlgI
MVFSSPIFLFYFLPVVLLFTYLFRRNLTAQNVVLFISSLIFYFWGEKEYTILVLLSVLINYSIGYGLSKPYPARVLKRILVAGILINLSILLYYKYYNFFINDFLSYFGFSEPLAAADHIHLPLGISFFTFHGITYIVDLYRNEADRNHSFLTVSLYTLFFPQLIAGPIVRFTDISRQLTERNIQMQQVQSGVRRFVIGLAKKILIANALGRVADHVYALEIADLSPQLIWFGIGIFALQLYYDFSGYSDMAIGLARIFGFEFKENFNFPYAATSLSDLWKRWHISLTTFFRNYVYFPLGGSQLGEGRTYVNLIVVFFLTGLWHGPSWNCILWGLFTGVFIVLEKVALGKFIQKWPAILANIYTLFLFITALMIFKIEDGQFLAEILSKAFLIETESSGLYHPTYFMTNDVYVILAIAIFFAYPVHQLSISKRIASWPLFTLYRDVVYACLFLLSITMMAASTYNPFIYFKF